MYKFHEFVCTNQLKEFTKTFPQSFTETYSQAFTFNELTFSYTGRARTHDFFDTS